MTADESSSRRGDRNLDHEIGRARADGDFARIDELIVPLAERAASGDSPALDRLLQLVLKHRLAEGAIRKLLIDEDDVNDAVQATLMSLNRAIASFEGRARFTTWLYRVAEREALQVIRRNKRVPSPDGEDMSGLAEEVRRMSSIIASHEALRDALDQLDPKLREPVILRDVEGLDYAAIAERLDVPLNTVRTRIRRGRQLVAEKIMGTTESGAPPES